ncbi:MAG: hypothetical protein M1834_009256 [Cirrosporium novae-zelandiae]|nr:MAG: hypothetical protein M1834_009256 [Cirrosporium novae-zelandiae]
MLDIVCRGTPYEIGFKHGTEARLQISRSIVFYAGMFRQTSKVEWPQVKETAAGIEREMVKRWPRYWEEMRGIADGAKVDLLDIVALNVRTEIAFGMFSDGCTSLYWKTEKRPFQAQNWDWNEAQKENLILITIHQADFPIIKMVTEAGIIGKIGLNSCGVGILFNAIRAKGMNPTHLPAHLGLRMALESTSAMDAVTKLETCGMASSAHILIGDPHEAIGLEFTSSTFARVPMDSHRRVIHTNHLLQDHPGVEESHNWIPDTFFRVKRMQELTDEFVDRGQEPGWEEFSRFFEDRVNCPASICRDQDDVMTKSATLFNIVMDLGERRAVVRLGKPTAVEETVMFTF